MQEVVMSDQVERRLVHVRGVVQGVGFRPYVYGLATSLGLVGQVANDPSGVSIDIQGTSTQIASFLARLPVERPRLASITGQAVQGAPPMPGRSAFTIVATGTAGVPDHAADVRALVAVDTVACEDCLREVDDPTDRRCGHPLATCTNCGPRLSIIEAVPYDRATTTMVEHDMCDACRAEYEDPKDRRFHAQPISCLDCGPRVRLSDFDGVDLVAVEAAGRRLLEGHVLGVKGLGGWHLAAAANDEAAVSKLRRRKHREDKPFAVMVTDLDQARSLVHLDEAGAAELSSPVGPVVLLARRSDAPVAPSVAPAMGRLGLLLPPSPLHRLLGRAVGRPIVLTSGNVSDEPIAFRDEDAATRLGAMSDGLLGHDRRIAARVDDSVITVVDGLPMVLRRSRGLAPTPLALPVASSRPLIAVGAQLKSTFCLARGHQAIASQHLGDLHHASAHAAFIESVEHWCRLFDHRPELIVHDRHPDYASTGWAESSGLSTLAVQHHHAHVASCLVDHGRADPVIGVAFDGTGHGDDGTLWGGEVLVADLTSFERVGHLGEVVLPGGETAIRQPWRMAAAHLAAAGVTAPADFVARHRDQWEDVQKVIAAGGGLSPTTTSIGRLFDAASSLAGVRDRITWEGQAAIELEQIAGDIRAGAHEVLLTTADPFVVAPGPIVAGLVADLVEGRSPDVIAARFHDTIVDVVRASCDLARSRHGLSIVALTGGVFQNVRLLRDARASLESDGFEVLVHRHVPPNDGGISIGQAAIAAASQR